MFDQLWVGWSWIGLDVHHPEHAVQSDGQNWAKKEHVRTNEKNTAHFFTMASTGCLLCRWITVNDRGYQKILQYKKPQSIKQFCLQQTHVPLFTSIWSYFTLRGRGVGVGGAVSFINSHVWLSRRHTRSSSCAIYSFSETALGLDAGCTSNTCSSLVGLAEHWERGNSQRGQVHGHVLLLLFPPFLPIV